MTKRLTTSQNATAPKQIREPTNNRCRLTTSQNATDPKPLPSVAKKGLGLTTSQNATAPKLLSVGSGAENFDSLTEFVFEKIRKDEEIVVVSDSNLVRITK